MQSVIDARVLKKFSQRFKGQVILPGDSDYEPARSVASFNPSTDKHPRIIARCADALLCSYFALLHRPSPLCGHL